MSDEADPVSCPFCTETKAHEHRYMWSQDTPAGMALAVSAAERDDLRAQLSAAVEAKTRAEGDAAALREAWQVYIDEYGLEHEGEEGGPDEDWSECPQDDTCSCPIVNKIRAALAPSAGSALLEEMKRKDEEIARLTKQRDDLRAANWDEVLADRTAERDEARREYQELGSSLDDVTDERDAARAEVAKLTRERDDARDSANIATGDLHCSWNALEKARAELAKLTRERDEAMVTRDSLLVELWEGVRAHGLWAPKQGRDGERLIHAYCGGIAKLRLEVEDARAALDAERKAHEETREHLRLTKHAFDVQCDLTDKAADAIRAERARREEAERERCERWQEKLSPLLARVATLEFRAAQLQGSLGAIRECCARCDDPAVTIAHIGSLAHAALAPAPTSSTPPPATKTSETLPMCGAPSCDNRADPRWFIHVNGHPIPACDGHGCGSLHPCAGCQQPPRADGGGK